MALSGTLDTFALPDVLRLLGSTQKTGRLRITGDRGSGSVWVDTGQVVATELTALNALEPTDIEVVFGLLRFEQGSFTFETDVSAPHAGEQRAMDSVLGAAEDMLAEWRSIEEVVPSLSVWVGLSPELDGSDVMIDASRWRCIAAIGVSTQVGAVAELLHLSEIESCRIVKELIELGLVEIIDEPAGVADSAPLAGEYEEDEHQIEEEPEGEESAGDSLPTTEDVDDDGDGGETSTSFIEESLANDAFGDAFADAIDGDDQQGAVLVSASSDTDTGGSNTVPSLASLAPSDEPAIDPLLSTGDPLETMGDASERGDLSPVDDDDDLNPAEMARQLANLSPKAAKAVAAAAKASTDAERDAALAAVEAEDDSVNRGLLLKFLGSVES